MPPPFEGGGAYSFEYVGMSVGCPLLVQLITREPFAPEAINFLGRQSFMSR